MKVGGLALRGQEVAHRSKKRTTTWAKGGGLLASVRRDLGQREEKRRGARTGGSSPIFL